MKGEVGRAFRSEFKMGIFSSASHNRLFLITPSHCSEISLPRILNRKLANTTNGMLVTLVDMIKSGSYGDVGFFVGSAEKEIGGIIELTA